MAASSIASAEPHRYALVIGANRGGPDDVELKYAESDAQSIASTLIDLGGFLPEDVIVLRGPRADDVRRVVHQLADRITRAADPEAALVVYYSGHGDAQSLHLSSSTLPMAELRQVVDRSTATARVLIVDSCRSGALTRTKGGSKGAAFQINLETTETARGIVVITSSAAGEDAQESDDLKASVFTFHLRSALGGSADSNGDGQVTVSEAFAFTKDATIATSLRSIVGIQHPTFEIALGGRADLVLTRTRNSPAVGTLELPDAGHWLVFRAGGGVVAELNTERAGQRIALRGGRYVIAQRRPTHLREGRVTITPGKTTTVGGDSLSRIEYEKWVRTRFPGTVPLGGKPVWSAFVGGGVRSDLRDNAPVLRLDAGLRLAHPRFSFEARLAGWRSTSSAEGLRAEDREASLAISALRVTDLEPITLGIGLEVGGGVLHSEAQRSMELTVADTAPLFTVGPVGQLQLPLGRMYARLDVAGLALLLREREDLDVPRYRATWMYRVALGAGFYF